MIRYILYWIFNTLLVRYACEWIQTRDSIEESSKGAKYSGVKLEGGMGGVAPPQDTNHPDWQGNYEYNFKW
jgi:hypothetical protein